MDTKAKIDQKLKQMIVKEKRSINNYNNSLGERLKTVANIEKEYETKESLKSFSWQLYEIDREAVEDFRRTHDCTYQDIIKYALRYYLSEDNYRHAKEILELRRKHDKEFYE